MKVKSKIVNISEAAAHVLDKLQAHNLNHNQKKSRGEIVAEALILFAQTQGVSLQ